MNHSVCGLLFQRVVSLIGILFLLITVCATGLISVLAVFRLPAAARQFLVFHAWSPSAAAWVQAALAIWFGILAVSVVVHFGTCATARNDVPADYDPVVSIHDPEAVASACLEDLDDVSTDEFPSYCSKCHRYRPGRAHHCSVCGKCILGYDHHCVFVWNCIGESNRRSFVSWVLAIAVSGVCMLCVSWPMFSDSQFYKSHLLLNFDICLAFALGTAFSLVFPAFAAFHLLLASNQSSSVRFAGATSSALTCAPSWHDLKTRLDSFFGTSNCCLWVIPSFRLCG